MIVCETKNYFQCPNGNISGNATHNTTVSTGSGNYSTQFKIPKFHPHNGLLTCVRFYLTIAGRVTMALENNVNSPAAYNMNYTRNDILTNPGLASPLTKQVSANYGPYNLDVSDGISFWGPDFVSIGPDTVLRSESVCRTLNDCISLLQSYGVDPVAYNYLIQEGAALTGSGDYLFSVATRGSVNYRSKYCYCPLFILPLSVYQIFITKLDPGKAEIKWSAFDESNMNYHYEIKSSHDGYNFSNIHSLSKNVSGHDYKFIYAAERNKKHNYFFRIKQVYSSGYTRFSELKSVELEKTNELKINIYPNPPNVVVGIKFVNIFSGKFLIQISNTQGQTVFSKEVQVYGESFRYVKRYSEERIG